MFYHTYTIEEIHNYINSNNIRYNISDVTIKSLIKASEGNISKVKTALIILKNTNNIKNPAAFLKTAIKEEYEEIKKAGFSYSNYDLEEIENALFSNS